MRVTAFNLFTLPDVASFQNSIIEHHVDVRKWRCLDYGHTIVDCLCAFQVDRPDILEHLMNVLQLSSPLALYFAAVNKNIHCMQFLLKSKLKGQIDISVVLDHVLKRRQHSFKVSQMLVDYGAKSHRIIPRQLTQFMDGRDRARSVSVILVGMRSKKVNRNVAAIIAQWVWATRGATVEWGVIRKKKRTLNNVESHLDYANWRNQYNK